MNKPYTPWKWWYRFLYGKPGCRMKFSLRMDETGEQGIVKGRFVGADAGTAAAVCLAIGPRTWIVTHRGYLFSTYETVPTDRTAEIVLNKETIEQLRLLMLEWRDGAEYGQASVRFTYTDCPPAPMGWLVVRDGQLAHSILWETWRHKKRPRIAGHVLRTGT